MELRSVTITNAMLDAGCVTMEESGLLSCDCSIGQSNSALILELLRDTLTAGGYVVRVDETVPKEYAVECAL